MGDKVGGTMSTDRTSADGRSGRLGPDHEADDTMTRAFRALNAPPPRGAP